jgi:hypothetical protein
VRPSEKQTRVTARPRSQVQYDTGIGALLPEKMKIHSRGSRLRVGKNPNR